MRDGLRASQVLAYAVDRAGARWGGGEANFGAVSVARDCAAPGIAWQLGEDNGGQLLRSAERLVARGWSRGTLHLHLGAGRRPRGPRIDPLCTRGLELKTARTRWPPVSAVRGGMGGRRRPACLGRPNAPSTRPADKPDSDTGALLKPQSAWLVRPRAAHGRAFQGSSACWMTPGFACNASTSPLPPRGPPAQPPPSLPPPPAACPPAHGRLPARSRLARWPPFPACLQDGGRPAAAGAAGAAGTWRSSTAHRSDSQGRLGAGAGVAGAASRFDTTIGGRSWREDERDGAPPQRRDARWGDAPEPGGAAAGRPLAEPHNPAWNDAPARGGRGRGAEVDSWKPRGEAAGGEWRAGGGAAEGGSSWRANDRWGGGAGGAPGAFLVPKGGERWLLAVPRPHVQRLAWEQSVHPALGAASPAGSCPCSFPGVLAAHRPACYACFRAQAPRATRAAGAPAPPASGLPAPLSRPPTAAAALAWGAVAGAA